MKIRYKGGRNRYEVSLNRIPYYFTPENNMTADIKEQVVINYIFSLPNRAEFEAVEAVKKEVHIAIEKPEKKEVIEEPTHHLKHKKGGKNG